MKNYLVLFMVCGIIMSSCAIIPIRSLTPLPRARGIVEQQKEYERINAKIAKGKIHYIGGNGLSRPNAIIIKGVNNANDGVSAEYVYIMRMHGTRGKDWELISQALASDEKGTIFYDILKIEDMKTKTKITYYFDITNFFGKF